MFFKKNKKSDFFNIQSDYEPEFIEVQKNDQFFEEALASHPHSANEPNRSFIGPVIHSDRFKFFTVVILIIFGLFIFKTASLQIVQGEDFRALAENNRTRIHVLPAQRGVIYDRNGKILAKNEPTFHLITAINQLPDKEDDRTTMINHLSKTLNLDSSKLLEIINQTKNEDEQILLAEHISHETAMKFSSLDRYFTGIDLEVSSSRQYITDQIPSLSHVLGYISKINIEEYEELKDLDYRRFDLVGKQGIESSYERKLRGTFGEEVLEVDALGNTERIVSKREPIHGENLKITIDADLQNYIEKVLDERMKGSGANKASVIVMDPNNGEILSLVSWPAFDSNNFAKGLDQNQYARLLNDERLPLFARAISGEFPSGSTIKPIYAAGALIDKIITPTTSFLSVGGLRVGPWFFPDWRAGGHGTTNVYHAIADSVNTFFYMIGGGNEQFEGMGVERLMEHAATFGFGSRTGIDIPGEADGFLPSKDWKIETKNEIWYIGDTYHVAIGQGDFLSTPLQIARATAVFANGGYLVTPHLNLELSSNSTKIVDDETVEIVAEGMRRTVSYGSAKSLSSLPVTSAGKTGTAQWSSVKENHAWYTGFAPFEDPEVVITVLIEEGAESYLAVRATQDILNWWFTREN